MKRIVLAAGMAVLALAPAASAAPQVTLRVEGESETLLSRTPVTLLDSAEPSTGCPGDSVAAALEVGTHGDWDRQPFTQTILGETHDFSNNDYWAFWVERGGRFQAFDAGICDERLASGEHVLATYTVADPNTYDPLVWPLDLEAVPATVAPGQPFAVTVAEWYCGNQYCGPNTDGSQDGVRRDRSGATVSAGDVSAVSGADGKATLTLTQRGPVALRATADNSAPSATETVCVTDGADGFCGTAKPGEQPAPAQPAEPCETNGADGYCGTRDGTPPVGRFLGVSDGDVFSRRKAPRTLRGTVGPDATGVYSVKVRLVRKRGKRCWYLSKREDRIKRVRCGTRYWIQVADSADWSYLLPRRLPRGRYVLDLRVRDGALNVDPVERGRSRLRFRVR